MVWAGVSLHHIINIVVIKGNLTAARYQHEVLDTEAIPLLRNHRGMQLLHDGDPAHHCIHVSECKYCKCRQLSPQITRLKHN